MEIETVFLAALQSSFILGLLHGVNPCGHSWLVLAPFITGERCGQRVVVLTLSFLTGTALACLVLGATLGAISHYIPATMGGWVEIGISIILLILGAILIYKPDLLHHHDHDHEHLDYHHEHHHGPWHEHETGGNAPCTHGHDQHAPRSRWFKQLTTDKRFLPLALFFVGFVNMVIPCPTAAVMYGYALRSGDALSATWVFGSYAVATAIAVGGVIYLLFRLSKMAVALQHDWVEPLIMRTAGLVIVVFSGYGLYNAMYVTIH